MSVQVFIVGATGYQGSTLVQTLLAHKGKYDISALVRTEQSGEKLRSQGVKTIVGDFSSKEALQHGASVADVVYSLASADHLDPVKVLVTALQPKGKKGVLIHTSGASVLADDSRSEFASDTIYSDADPERVEHLPPSQMHKEVDDWIRMHAHDITAVIVCPALIYGEAGDKTRTSVQIPLIFHAMLNTQKAATVGKGLAMWNSVHVVDLAHFYITLMASLLEHGDSADATDPASFYFVETAEFAWRDLFKAVADAMVNMGTLQAYEEMGVFSEDEMKEHFMGEMTWGVLGCNARVTGCALDDAVCIVECAGGRAIGRLTTWLSGVPIGGDAAAGLWEMPQQLKRTAKEWMSELAVKAGDAGVGDVMSLLEPAIAAKVFVRSS